MRKEPKPSPTESPLLFDLDPEPIEETLTALGGIPLVAQASRSLGLPQSVKNHVRVKERERGYDEATFVESFVILNAAGGDTCLERGLGFKLPKVGAVRSFLQRFHDEALELARPPRKVQKSFLMPSSAPVEGLQSVQAGVVRRIAQLYAQQQPPLRMATVDQEATIRESHKEAARAHHEGGRGYQPMVAIWAEADRVLAGEFRDGNVPAHQEPLTCGKLAFAALPENIQERYFRGDSACDENELGGGHMPSQHFAVNAAWFKLALLTYNIASAIKGLCLSPEERTARFKRYRLLLVHLAGRMSRFRCKLRLRFCACPEAIARVQKVWAVFALPTQATAFT